MDNPAAEIKGVRQEQPTAPKALTRQEWLKFLKTVHRDQNQNQNNVSRVKRCTYNIYIDLAPSDDFRIIQKCLRLSLTLDTSLRNRLWIAKSNRALRRSTNAT